MDEDANEDVTPIMPESSVRDIQYWRDGDLNRFFLTGEITQEKVDELVRDLLHINFMNLNDDEDHDEPIYHEPIYLYISSDGGDEEPAFELIDVIQNSLTPIYTVNMGCEYSAAFLIGLAGRKRFSMPNARFMIHESYIELEEYESRIGDLLSFHKEVLDNARRFVLDHSSITEQEYDNMKRTDWYFTAKSAKSHGIVDCVIGDDCDLAEVLI